MTKLLLFFLFFGWILNAQHYSVKRYSLNEGLPQSQVFCIADDVWGNVWMGTRGGGLVKFDGLNFEIYNSNNSLVNNYINDIYRSPDSLIIVSTNDGLSIFNGVNWKNKFIKKNLTVHEVLEWENEYWCATEEGLYRTSDWEAFEELKFGRITGNPVYQLLSRGRNLYIGGEHGLYKYNLDSVKLISSKIKNINQLIGFNQTIYGVAEKGGFFRYQDEELSLVPLPEKLQRDILSDVVIYKGQLLFATMYNGVWSYNQVEFSPYLNDQQGLSTNHCKSFFVDRWDELWIGTSGGGVNHFRGERFERIDPIIGLNNPYIYQVVKSHNFLAVSTAEPELYYYSLDTTIHFEENNGLNKKVKALEVSNSGELFIGTDGQGLLKLQEDSLVSIKFESFLGSFIYDIEFIENQIVLATDEGVLVKEMDGVQIYDIRNGLPQNRVNQIRKGSNGKLWFACRDKGIGFIQNGAVTNLDLDLGNVRSFVIDQRSNVWCLSESKELIQLNEHTGELLNSYGVEHGMPSSNLYSIVIDRLGDLWIGSDRGITQLKMNEDGIPNEFNHFGENEGVDGIETNLRSIYTYKDRIYIGTIEGLYHTNVYHEEESSEISDVFFNDIQLSYKNIFEAKNIDACNWYDIQELNLDYDENDLFFDFSSVNLKKPREVVYSWQLVNWDEQATPYSERHSAIYNNLKSGRYEFVVNAKDQQTGVVKTRTLKVFIATPIWEEKWFLLSSVFLIVLFALLFVRSKILKVKRESQRVQDELNLKNEVLELKHKALQLQMNPHFIFNVLNSIQAQIVTGNYDKSRQGLTLFSKLMRQILNHSREEWVLLQDELELMRNYVDMESFNSGIQVDFSIDVDEEVIEEGVKVIPMIIQPFIENTIIHGFKGREKGSVALRFTEKQNFFEVEIEDDGIGFQKGQEMKSSSHKSQGLDVTKDRLMNYFGEEDSVRFVELKKNEEVYGTKVILKLPYRY